MKTTSLIKAVHRKFAATAAALILGLGATPLPAAPGDKLLNATNPGLGAPNNLDPYFLDYNRAFGMAPLSNGNVVVAWSERENTTAPAPSPDSPDGANGKKDACFFRVYGPTGTTISAATRPYLDINSDGTGWQNTPLVAALSGGGFVITWNSVAGPGDTFDDTFGTGGDTWARVYDNSGVAVSATFRVNENDPNGVIDTQQPRSVVGLSGGGFAILWEDGNDNAAGLGANNNTDDFFVRVFAANGAPAAGSVRLGGLAQDSFFKDFEAFGGSASGMVALSNNTVAVGWAVRDKNNDGTGISADGATGTGGGASYFQIFNSSGAAVNSATNAYLDINPNGSGSQLAPALAALSGGGVAVVWNSNHNTDDGGNSDVGIGGNGTSGGDTYVRVYSNTGAAVSATSRVNDFRNDDTETPSAVVRLSDGGFAIVWKENDDNTAAPLNNTDDHFARAFNANGTPRNPSIRIGGAAADALFEDISSDGGLIALTDGGFVAGIRVRDSANNGTGTSLDGGGYSAAVRVFNADGTSRTAPFFPYGDINPDFSGNQNTPILCPIAGGGFAVTWHSNQNSNDTDNDLPFVAASTSNGGDTYTRLYNNSGTPLHGTVQAHSEGASEPTGIIDQQDPFDIIPLSGGNYAIVIRDDNDNSGNLDDLFLSVFEGVAPVGPSAPEISVTQTGAGNIADGGASAFGTTTVGTSVTKTFTVTNAGTANLTLSNLTVSSGFSIAANFGSTTLAPSGGFTTFQITMLAAAAGAPSGTLSFDNNDADENPYNFTVGGTVNALPPTVTAISPNTGTTLGGTSVTITGTNFTGATAVTIGGTAATIGTISPTEITATTSAHGAGVVDVAVTTPGGTGTGTGLFTYILVPTDPVLTLLAKKGGAVPGAGSNGIPAAAIWVSFGAPSINDAGKGTVLATYKDGTVSTTAIFGFDVADLPGTMRIVAKKGGTAPDVSNAVMSTIKDPLLAPDGSIAWLASLSNAPTTTGAVTTADNSAIYLDADGAGPGAAIIVARKGAVATGAAAAAVVPQGVDALPEWGTFISVAMDSTCVAFTATLASKTTGLTGAPGPGGVTKLDDFGVWVFNRTSSSTALALREGNPLLGSTIKTINALVARPGSPGQGRGVGNYGDDYLLCRVTLADKRLADGFINGNGGSSFPYITGGPVPDYGAGALWQSFGVPTQSGAYTAMAFLGTVKSLTGTATAANNVAIFAEDDGFSLARIVSKGDGTGISGGIFSALKDPVNAANRSVAFLGTMKTNTPAGIGATNNDGIWRSDSTNGLSLVAREGAQPPEAPAGAQWKKFSSLALPEGSRGPIFVAAMHNKTGTVSPGPGGITTANDVGLWATDSFGSLRLLLQEGDTMGTSIVKTFAVLSSVTGSPAQTRSFNGGGGVIVKVTDTLGAQHLVHIAVP